MRSALLALALSGCALPAVRLATPFPTPRLEVEPVWGLGFFEDEEPAAQALVAEALRARGFEVAEPEQTRAAWALAAEGRDPLTGRACGRRLSSWAARERWGAALNLKGSISPHVWCTEQGGCALSLSGDAGWMHAPLAPGEAPLAALRAALSALSPPPASKAGGGGLGVGGLGTRSGGAREADRLVTTSYAADVRRRTDDRAPPFPTLAAEPIAACLPRRDAIDVRAAFSDGGQLTRCEPLSAADRAEGACVCGALARAAAAPSLAGQRWQLSLRLERREVVSPDGALVISASTNTRLEAYQVPGETHPRYRPQVEDPSIAGWVPPTHHLLEGCFAGAFTEPGRVNSRWAVWFDGNGSVMNVEEQKTSTPLTAEQRDCVARALRTSESPCPAKAGLWAMVDVQVSARAAH